MDVISTYKYQSGTDILHSPFKAVLYTYSTAEGFGLSLQSMVRRRMRKLAKTGIDFIDRSIHRDREPGAIHVHKEVLSGQVFGVIRREKDCM